MGASDLARERGVDLSLLRARLRLTPTERVEENLQALAEALRATAERGQPPARRLGKHRGGLPATAPR